MRPCEICGQSPCICDNLEKPYEKIRHICLKCTHYYGGGHFVGCPECVQSVNQVNFDLMNKERCNKDFCTVCRNKYCECVCGTKPEETEESAVNHPQHYGGEHNPYETIKVIDAWKLDFSLGNTIKYISRCQYKGAKLQDLEKALWYLNHAIELLKGEK